MSSFYTYNKESEIGRKCFIIAEIGQNHQGSLETAKKMIKAAKECGADCVKFQKSNLEAKFTQAALVQPYNSGNSFGATYGDHKKCLEFTIDEYKELMSFAKFNDILFTASAMDHESYKDLRSLNVPFIKIGSGDNNNWMMLETISQDTKMPIVISTGMQDISEVKKLHEIFGEKENVAILHCVSSYPTKSCDVNLRFIQLYHEMFPNRVIGYSGHESTPVVISLGAVALGAKIVERHFTLDKNLKGSDHSCSLVPYELKMLVKMIRLLEEKEFQSSDTQSVIEFVKNIIEESGKLQFLDDLHELQEALSNVKAGDKKVLECEMSCYKKLRKTLVYARDILKGSQIQKGDFAIKVNTIQGIPTEKIDLLLGKTILRDVRFEGAVKFEDFGM